MKRLITAESRLLLDSGNIIVNGEEIHLTTAITFEELQKEDVRE